MIKLGSKGWAKQIKKVEEDAKKKKRESNKKYYLRKREKIIDYNKKNYRKIRYNLYLELGGKCKLCDKRDISDINFHHTIPMMVYESKIYHYRRNKDILIPLCRKCHETLHFTNDWLYIDDIYKDIERRE